jgi:hypothetical protein
VVSTYLTRHEIVESHLTEPPRTRVPREKRDRSKA